MFRKTVERLTTRRERRGTVALLGLLAAGWATTAALGAVAGAVVVGAGAAVLPKVAGSPSESRGKEDGS